ncbi:MAG: alpha amylase catalytic region [Ferruginibacter sp.]|nr:alpha amylase catalytic region [Ferruginibacter sp.]
MGVEILWFMPIHPIGVQKRKGTMGSYYSIQDHEAINPEFGSRQDFVELVEAIHAHGMKIILDWVANHTSWDHVWTLSNPEFFVKDADGNFTPPYDWDDVLQLDHSSVGEQEAMINAMKFWVTGFGIDGFRADLAHLTPLPFWIEARKQLTAINNELIWLAETEEIHYHDAFDISFTWAWMHKTEEVCKGHADVGALLQLLKTQQEQFPRNARRMYFTSNHDENSWNGTEYEKYGSYARALAVFSCCYESIPMIYNGQELPNLKRLQFFDKDVIAWNDQYGLHDFYKVLLALRKRNRAAGANENINTVFDEESARKGLLIFRRLFAEDEIIVVMNLAAHETRPSFPQDNHTGYKNIFTGDEVTLDEMNVALAPGDFLVLEKITNA